MSFTKTPVAGQDIESATFRKFFGDYFTEFVKTGFEVSEGTGLVVDISAGTAYVKDASGYMFQIVSGGTETTTLADNSTNYVFLHSDNGATYITDSTSAAVPNDAILLATVVTASGDVTSVTDNRVLTPHPLTPAICSTLLTWTPASGYSTSKVLYFNPSGTRTITFGKIKFTTGVKWKLYYNVGAGDVEVSDGDVIGASNSADTSYNAYIKATCQAYNGAVEIELSLEYTIQ